MADIRAIEEETKKNLDVVSVLVSLRSSVTASQNLYRMAGNFHGRKLLRFLGVSESSAKVFSVIFYTLWELGRMRVYLGACGVNC